MPSWPIAMPSSMAMVLNSLATPPACLDLARHQLAEVLQMDMAGHELGEGIDDGDDRLAEIPVLHAGGAPQAARAGHVAAVGGRARAIGGHGLILAGFRVFRVSTFARGVRSAFRPELAGRRWRRKASVGWAKAQRCAPRQHHHDLQSTSRRASLPLPRWLHPLDLTIFFTGNDGTLTCTRTCTTL